MGIPSWAVPGAKVVCVDASPSRISRFAHDLVVGNEYTIVETIAAQDGRVGCTVAELSFPKGCWALLSRFRPLVTNYTEAHDVAKFTKHLTAPSPELADA